VNASGSDFEVTEPERGEIRFGLSAVKGVGENAVAAIMAARAEGGAFASIWDFCRRIEGGVVNKRALESLIRAGALDSTGATRLGMLEALPLAMGQAARRRNDAALGQESLFGMFEPGPVGAAIDLDPVISALEMDREDLLRGEQEALGLYVSSHPLQECAAQLARAVTCGLAALADRGDGELVTVGGLVGAVKAVTTRRGEPMVFVRLDDLESTVEVVVVPAVCAEVRPLLQPGAILLVSGRVDQKGDGETKLVAQQVRPFGGSNGAAPADDQLLVRVDAALFPAEHLARLKAVLADHRGQASVVLEMRTDEGPVRLRFGDQFRVDPRDRNLKASLKALFGERCLA
jgi:DNA polymerase-3 subunit alpha